MSVITMHSSPEYSLSRFTTRRIESIDLLRGIVMIIMAIDHTRDYFHSKAFIYSPTDLSHTDVLLFLTRWITHYCAPVFVFLAGISAYLYGTKKSKNELAFYLLSRGLFLVLAEPLLITLEWTFNPNYPFFNLQVIFAIGVSMIALSGIIYLNRYLILFVAIALMAAHNLLDTVHVPGAGAPSFIWGLLHEPGDFAFGRFIFSIRFPVLPWIGIITAGYYIGRLYSPGYGTEQRKKKLMVLGWGAIALYILLRAGNFYGDAAHWSTQKNVLFSVLSFLNVTKYPPSLLYILMTLGPALLFLSFAEKPLTTLTSRISVFGRVPMFYYIAHIFLIHLLALFGAAIAGYHWEDMILTTRVNSSPVLKGYGFNLFTVYCIWLVLILLLYPLCKWYDRYKRAHSYEYRWLSYL
jgi:uncharacterized membrane protein